jgi:hypothetical protein
MVVVVGVSFVAGFVVPLLIGVLPANVVNLPHKEYWLAAERREETMRYLSMKMGWFACAALSLLLFLTSEAINANRMDSLISGQRSRCCSGSWHSWESGQYCYCVTSIAFLSRLSGNRKNRESLVTRIHRAVTKLTPASNDLSLT